MMRACACGLLLLAAAAHGASSVRAKEAVTPIEKVIDLLHGLSAKITDAGKAEAKQYDEFACFCKEQADQKLYNIEKSRALLKELDAKIKELSGEIDELNGAISDLSTLITDKENLIEKISDERAKDHSEYLVQAKDMTDAISAIARALEALANSKDGQEGDVKTDLAQVQALAVQLLELSSRLSAAAPSEQQVAMLSKVAKGGPHAYEFHSNDIIATLKGLQKTFKKNKQELDEAEFKTNSAFEKKRLGEQNEVKFAKKERSEKEALSESKSEEKAAAQETEAQANHDKDADQAFLDELTGICETKAEQFDQRSKMRSDELTAIASAVGELESGAKPNAGANKKLVGLAQSGTAPAASRWVWVADKKADVPAAAPRATSFLQLRGSSDSRSPTVKVFELLQAAAGRLGSPLLSAAAVKVQVSADHFVKVRGLIKDLIQKLKDDAKAEEESKGFCDEEMGKATTARDEAKMTIEEKTADISKKSAEKAKLLEEIQELEEAIAANMKALNEATEQRNKEAADNKKTLADSGAGKDAVEFALTTLKEFYESAAGLVQTGYTPPNADREGKTVSDRAPEVFSGTYHGNQAQSKGIIGLLEVILSDFERTLEVVGEQEEKSEADFDAFEQKTEEDTESKNESVKEKKGQVADLEDDITELTDENKDAHTKLDGALEELEKLKPMCVEGEETYEERVAKRQQEIAALKEAMQILIDWQGL